ncbi:hypothetical protein LINPERHAP1_LOCUS27235 [Linum perenne]
MLLLLLLNLLHTGTDASFLASTMLQSSHLKRRLFSLLVKSRMQNDRKLTKKTPSLGMLAMTILVLHRPDLIYARVMTSTLFGSRAQCVQWH